MNGSWPGYSNANAFTELSERIYRGTLTPLIEDNLLCISKIFCAVNFLICPILALLPVNVISEDGNSARCLTSQIKYWAQA